MVTVVALKLFAWHTSSSMVKVSAFSGALTVTAFHRQLTIIFLDYMNYHGFRAVH